VIFCVFDVFSHVYFVFSVPVQVISWKDSSLKCVQRDVKLLPSRAWVACYEKGALACYYGHTVLAI